MLAVLVVGFALPPERMRAVEPGESGTTNTVVCFDIRRGGVALGRMEVELFDREKPQTVRNFLLYVQSGAYSNGFLHRCVPGFVVQGGGFAVANPDDPARFASYLTVTNYGRLTNEFLTGTRLSNVFGTLVMAKVAEDPNSATSQWFFNLGNNTTNLDNQNGGFTVFGRVLESTNTNEGTNLLAHFNTVSTSAGIVNLGNLIGPAHRVFSDLPVAYLNTVFRVPAYNELYQVNLSVLNRTNQPGVLPPDVRLLSPGPNERFTNQVVTLRGTARDDAGVARIVYRVGDQPLEIAAGTTNWEVNLRPQPGFNTVMVQSIDCDGLWSTNTGSVTFLYVAQHRLDLQVMGKGTVRGATNGMLLQAGRLYSFTASPSAGQVFDGWSGSVTSTGPTLTFQVPVEATNFSLVARFKTDPLTTLTGTYHGLVRAPSTPALDDTAFLTLALSRNGRFSGALRHRGGRYVYTGRFDRDGNAFVQGTVGGVNRSLSLRLNLTNLAGVITGSFFGGAGSGDVQLDRLASTLSGTNPPPAGRYTFVLPPPISGTPRQLIPGGHGFATSKLSRAGTLQISGRLGDGTTFTSSARRSLSGRWPLHTTLAGGRGVLAGWLSPSAVDARNLDGSLHWIRFPNLKATRYALGFTNQIACLGSFYVPPVAGTRVLDWVYGLARVSGANLELGVTNLVKLSSGNLLVVADAVGSGPTFTFQLASGALKGRFVHPWLGTTNELRGVILKRDDSLRGQFLEADQSGSLLVSQAPFLVTQRVDNVSLAGLTAAMSEGGWLQFENDGVITLTGPLQPKFDVALDANGHDVLIDGNHATRLFEVRTNRTFIAVGVQFANGQHAGTNGANGSPPQPGGDGCGAGILNLGGLVSLTNCLFTNFIVMGGRAGADTTTNQAGAFAGSGLGAAICNRGGRLILQGCVLENNQAWGGPGRAASGTDARGADGAPALGGAIFSDGGESDVGDTVFRGNQVRGGEPSFFPGGEWGRSGDGLGGALAVTRGRLGIRSSSFLTNVTTSPGVTTNSVAVGFARGGALFVDTNAEVSAEQTLFSNNAALGPMAAPTAVPGHAADGAVFNAGTVRLRDCTLEYNAAQGGSGAPAGPGYGGAVASLGTLVLEACTLNDNHAQGGAGSEGGMPPAGGAEGSGGALHATGGSFIATNSTFAFNRARGGPASSADGVRGDARGGALTLVSNTAVLIHLTVASNGLQHGSIGDTNTGTALGAGIAATNATVSLRSSILAGNAPAGFFGTLTDLGYNLSSDTSVVFTATGSLSDTNPFLGPLTTNGGSTRTMALLADSPARDRVPLGVLAPIDQRGFARPQGAAGDSGAFEAAFIPPPPTFVVMPAGGTVRVGANFTLRAIATGHEPIFYFWMKDDLLIPGATNSTYVLPNVQTTNAGNYAAVATNISGVATSLVATLTVEARPLILSQPADVMVAPGGAASFGVTVDGPALSFQWLHNSLPIDSGTNAVLLITNAAPGDQGTYQVIVTNYAGAVTSRVASLTFSSLALSLLIPPQDTTVFEGQSVSLRVLVSGIPPFAYQWLFESVPLPYATNSVLEFPSAHPTHSGRYRVVVTNAYASLSSDPVVLSVVTSTPLTVVRGPYLQSGSPTRAVVRWRTDQVSDAVVRYGTTLTNLDNAGLEPMLTNEHLVSLSGLQPDTRYFYAIGSSSQQLAGGTNAGGEDYWFRTAPLPGTPKRTRFWVLGDSGTAGNSTPDRQILTRTAYEMYAATNGPADFWLMLGDNAYNNGTDAEYQRAVFDLYPATLRNLFLWPALGNHETSQSFVAADFPYLHIFSPPRNAEAGGVASGSPRYYSFDHANIHFICLDSMSSGHTTNTAMAQWLLADLAATDQAWIVVFFHHPPYSKGSHDSDAETELIDIRQNFLPILEAHGVDLVLTGHSHSYERSFLLNGHYGFSTSLSSAMKLDGGDGRTDGTGAYRKNGGLGTVYVVAGNSGQVSGGPLNHPAQFLSLNDLGTLVVDVESNRLDLVLLSTNAAVHDRFTLIKEDPAPNAIGVPPVLAVAMDATHVFITCRGAAGQVHRLQSASTLDRNAFWVEVASEALPATGVFNWSIPRSGTGPRFYRVVSP